MKSTWSVLLFAAYVAAQTPPFIGELLIQPVLNNGKCLTAKSNTNGAAVTLQSCTGAPSQKFTFSGGGITLYGGSKCLDVSNGQNMQIWDCAGNANQKFYYTGDNRLSWTDHGKCLDLTGGKADDGSQVQMANCDNARSSFQIWNVGYMANALPHTSQGEQTGINNCGTGDSTSANCQTAWINSADDFCLWAPPSKGSIGDTEREEIAWCTKSGRGARTIPNGALKGVHFVKTPDYVQVTGRGDFTLINIPKGDQGGELDNRGADGRGNPIGGLVFGNSFGTAQQYHEWTSFISDNMFCFRACVGPKATSLCNHIFDEMGCEWNMPANYKEGEFENCDGDDDQPMGVYGTSTWHQGVKPTPSAHPAASSSNCHPLPSVSVSPANKRRDGNGMVLERRGEFVPTFPGATPAP